MLTKNHITLVFCIIVVTTINFYDLFSIANVPPRLENRHIWHSPRLYSTYFIKKMSHHLCKSARDDEFENHENQKWIFEKSISIRNVILKNKESIDLHLQDDTLLFRITSLERIKRDSLQISILFHTWLTKWLHELGAKYKSIIVLRWYDGNIDMLRWDYW